VTDPGSLPNVAGQAVVNVETEAAEQIGNMESSALNVRNSVVDALGPTSATQPSGDGRPTLAVTRSSMKAEPDIRASDSTKRPKTPLSALRDQVRSSNERMAEAVTEATERVRDAVDNVGKQTSRTDDNTAENGAEE
jgi:hypothetical protein